MKCAVYPKEKAEYNDKNVVFQPCKLAQKEGWRLVRARTWFGRLLLRMCYEN